MVFYKRLKNVWRTFNFDLIFAPKQRFFSNVQKTFTKRLKRTNFSESLKMFSLRPSQMKTFFIVIIINIMIMIISLMIQFIMMVIMMMMMIMMMIMMMMIIWWWLWYDYDNDYNDDGYYIPLRIFKRLKNVFITFFGRFLNV